MKISQEIVSSVNVIVSSVNVIVSSVNVIVRPQEPLFTYPHQARKTIKTFKS